MTKRQRFSFTGEMESTELINLAKRHVVCVGVLEHRKLSLDVRYLAAVNDKRNQFRNSHFENDTWSRLVFTKSKKKTVKVIPGHVSQKKKLLSIGPISFLISVVEQMFLLFLCISMTFCLFFSFCLRMKFVNISVTWCRNSALHSLLISLQRERTSQRHGNHKKNNHQMNNKPFCCCGCFSFCNLVCCFAVRYNSLNYYWKLVSFRSLVGTIVGCYERYRMLNFNFSNSVFFLASTAFVCFLE